MRMRGRLTLPRLLLLLVEIAAVAILAVAASRHFGLPDGLRISVAYLVAYLVPLAVLQRARGTSLAAHALLLGLTVFLGYVCFDCLVSWTKLEGYSLQMPNVEGDARDFYKSALHYYDGSMDIIEGIFPGFPLMMVGLWKVLGLSVVWPQAMNLMFTLTTVVLTGMTTRRLLAHRVSASSSVLVFSGMALVALQLYYLMSGISILKEGVTFFSISLVGYSLSSMDSGDEDRHWLWRDIALIVLAGVLLAFVRTTFIYLVMLGVVIMTIPHWRRDWLMSLCLLVVLGVLLVVGNHFAAYSFDRHAEIVGGGWNMQRTFSRNSFHQQVMGFYFLYSKIHKVALLPVTMGLQFIEPLPWMDHYEEPYLLSVLDRVTWGWYIVGGTVLFYCLFISWRRGENMGYWPWWPVIIYVGMAYVMGGVMARYLLPFKPLMVPVAVYVFWRLYEGRWRRGFTAWSIVFVVMLAVALLICLELKTGVVSGMLHTESLLHNINHLI